MGDAHLEGKPEGLGPGLPINVLGLSPTDPLAQMPLVNFGPTDVASQLPNPGNATDPATLAAQNPAQPPTCVLVCYGPAPLPPVAPMQGTDALPDALLNPLAPPNPLGPQPGQLAPQPGPLTPLPGHLAPPPAAVPTAPSPSPSPVPALPPTHGPLPGPTS
jgi:hypothetical protein